jgi:hypothetical protein
LGIWSPYGQRRRIGSNWSIDGAERIDAGRSIKPVDASKKVHVRANNPVFLAAIG